MYKQIVPSHVNERVSVVQTTKNVMAVQNDDGDGPSERVINNLALRNNEGQDLVHLADDNVADGDVDDVEVADDNVADDDVPNVEVADDDVPDVEVADDDVRDVEVADVDVADVEVVDDDVSNHRVDGDGLVVRMVVDDVVI